VNLDRLLAPRSVAVVGASARVDTYGHQTLDNLVAAQFDGPVYGVHPRETEVLGIPCFPTLSDLPEVPDAIVIATPAATVPGLVDEAGRLGVGGASETPYAVDVSGLVGSKVGDEQLAAAAAAAEAGATRPHTCQLASGEYRKMIVGAIAKRALAAAAG